jgi:hypothetical protein
MKMKDEFVNNTSIVVNSIFHEYVENRNVHNPFINTKNDEWLPRYRLSMQEFSTLLNLVIYKKDPLFGLIDYTSNMDKFFDNKKFGRDCDEYARAWMLWGVHNGFNAQEMVVTTIDSAFSDAHVVTILNKDNNYYLCNYTTSGPFQTFDDALNDLKRWERYADGFISAYGIYQERLV